MSKRQSVRSYVQPMFNADNDPAALVRAGQYIGEDGTFSGVYMGNGIYLVYLHDEITPGGFLIGGSGGGGHPDHLNHNETITLQPNGYSLVWDDQDGGVLVFDDGRISADADNSVYRGTDGGLYVGRPRFINAFGPVPITIAWPDLTRDYVILMRPQSANYSLTIPDGAFHGQKVRFVVLQSFFVDGPWGINHSGGRLEVADQYGFNLANAPYQINEGDGLTLIWSDTLGSLPGWYAPASHRGVDLEEKLVFAGSIANGSVIAPGFQTIPMDVAFDPYSAWSPGTNTYLPRPRRDYRVSFSFAGNTFPFGTFTRIDHGNGYSSVLPPVPPADFAFHHEGWANSANTFGLNNQVLALQLFNATGAPFTIDASIHPHVAAKTWQMRIYETYVF